VSLWSPAGQATAALSLALVAGLAETTQRGSPTPAPGPASAAMTFTNIAPAAGLDFRHVNGASADRHLPEIMSGGGLFFDFDNDGWTDVFLVDGGSLVDRATAGRARHRLYHNRGNGTFEDLTARSGITHTQYGMGACAADYDNDGFTDLYVTNVGPNVLYHNNGTPAGARFTDVTRTAGVGSRSFAASCAFADVDRDGYVDLFVTNYVDARLDNNIFCGDAAARVRVYCHPLNFAPLSSVLYHNNHDGTFTDISQKAGISPHRGNGLGVVFGDYDDDGWVDGFVANDTTPNFLYRNDGKGGFKEAALASGVAVASDGRPRAGMGTDFGDVDGDGRLDLIVTNHELEMHTLFRNLGKGLFADATLESGVGRETLPYVGFGAQFLDYDNDGDLDLAIINGHVMNDSGHFRPGSKEAQRKLLFRNDGKGRFVEVGRAAGPGFAVEAVGRMLAVADIDNDGDLDILVTNNGGPVELLRNDTAPGHALLLRLVGTSGNRGAVGARIRLTAGSVSQVREIKAGSSYLGQSDLRAHFGLGQAIRADRIEIRWPGGETEVVENAAANQILTVTEGRGVTARTAFVRR
jgi:hypothetical protein